MIVCNPELIMPSQKQKVFPFGDISRCTWDKKNFHYKRKNKYYRIILFKAFRSYYKLINLEFEAKFLSFFAVSPFSTQYYTLYHLPKRGSFMLVRMNDLHMCNRYIFSFAVLLLITERSDLRFCVYFVSIRRGWP